jgi:regulator of protease activity HflC (stomatin/prohibitin superfamily)
MASPFIFGLLIVIGMAALILLSGVRVLNEYERGVIFRLGRIADSKQPGLRWLIPFVDRMVRISTRIIATDVPPQDIITKDNVSVKVNAVIYFKVMDPVKAVIEVENYLYATSQFSQTTLRSILGQSELDELLSEREKINLELQTVIDKHTDPWGVKVTAVEVKHVDLPHEMQRAMARQAEAERERRAKIIAADGEFQASQKLHEAAVVLSQNSIAIQLRYLQTLSEIAGENNSTTIFPVPLDFIKPFMENMGKKSGD